MPEMTYRQALHEALREEMERDSNVFILGEEVGIFGGSYRVSEGLLKDFGPERVLDTPIAENAIIGLATGAAMTGLRPVAEIMTINFIIVGMDQLVNNAAKIPYMFGGETRVPLVVRTPSGRARQLTAQHSQSLEVWFAYVPGMYVVAPATPADAKGLLKTCIRDDNPILFVENVLLYNEKGEVPEGDHLVPLGHADVKREGDDVTIIAYSSTVSMALHAADQLADSGISAEVIDLRSLRPLDVPTIVESIKKTNHAIIVTEGWKKYGPAAEIIAQIQEHAFDYLDHPVERVTGVEVPMPYARALEDAALPKVEYVVESARSMLGKA